MIRLKQVGAGLLVLVGFWCLGRSVETALDRNPNRLEKRETVLAGLLLGIPTTVGGIWLGITTQQQKQSERRQHLQRVFFQVCQQYQGQITPMQLAAAADISGAEAKAYLSEQARIYNGTFQVSAAGGIIFCFETDKRLESDY